MKIALVLQLGILVVASFHCEEISGAEHGRVVVYLHWQEMPLQRKVEILETDWPNSPSSPEPTLFVHTTSTERVPVVDTLMRT